MAERTGNLQCTLYSWAAAFLIGTVAALMMGILGGIGWNGSVFLGAVLAVALGIGFALIFCRPLPTMAEAQARHAATMQAPRAPSAPQAAAVHAAASVAAAPMGAAAVAPAATVAPAAPAPAPEPVFEAVAEPAATPVAESVAPPAAEPAVAEPAAAPAAEPAAAPAEPAAAEAGTKPEALAAPRETGADDLKKISGVGPKLEGLLHSLGIYHFDQIAAWGAAEIAWMDQNLEGFRGRVSRDNWVDQARDLAAGQGG